MSAALPPGDPRHGTGRGYNLGCRCPTCRQGNAYRQAAARRRRRAAPIPEWVQHGKRATYINWWCRCPDCKAAHSEMLRAQRQRRRSGPIPDWVQHGDPNTYTTWFCRCPECKKAEAARKRRIYWTKKQRRQGGESG